MSESKTEACITEIVRKLTAGIPVDRTPLDTYLDLIDRDVSPEKARRILSLYLE